MSVPTSRKIWLIRHGETEWSLSGQHTGTTDIPMTEKGQRQAVATGRWLAAHKFALVLTSPRTRARETARIAGYGNVAQIDMNLQEWEYGLYEGRKTVDIRQERPGWFIWKDGPLEGETIDQVAARADAVIKRATDIDGQVAFFAHGHILRIIGARWIGLPGNNGQKLGLDTGSVSVLGYEHSLPVIREWNTIPPLVDKH
jgi:probable phosphoglycerate mutase